jgi:DNA-binding PucR family transcriptional regulator
MHRNTVRDRIRRLQELIGRDRAPPLDVGEVNVALGACGCSDEAQ